MQKIIEKEFIYKGLACYITLDSIGTRCGYVALPQETYIKCDISSLNCHGNITYLGKRLPGIDKEDGDKYIIGFDCAHLGDRKDAEKAKEAFGEYNLFMIFDYADGEIRTVEFCEKELENLVEQIKGAC